jgi:PrcB C-terminal
VGAIVSYQETGSKLVRKPVAWFDITATVGAARWARPTISVVRNRTKLAKLFEVALLPPRPDPPRVDFSRREVVAIAVGPRSSTGYSLHVVRVTQSGNIDILVRERTPSLGEPVKPVVTFPYLLLTVPQSGKHVSVKYAGR